MENEIDHLFSFVNPIDLRKSVLTVFFSCCSNRNEMPENFQKVSEDIQHLVSFFERASEHKQL